MEKFLYLILAIMICAIAIFFMSGYASDKAAKYEAARGNAESSIKYAQSDLTRAHGQAAIDRAEAFQIRAESTALAAIIHAQSFQMKMESLLPFGIILSMVYLSMIIIALLFLFALNNRNKQYQIIERHIVYLPPPNMSRREVWQQLSDSSYELNNIVEAEVKITHD